MEIMDLRKLSETIAARRDLAIQYVPADQRETKRSQGSDYPTTWEDAARRIAEGGGEKAFLCRTNLERYQNALNELYLWAFEQGVHKLVAQLWLKRQSKLQRHERDEAEAEVVWILRKVCAGWAPRAGQDGDALVTSFVRYATTIAFRHLNEWRVRFSLPVEVPQKAVQRLGHSAVAGVSISLDELLEAAEQRAVAEDSSSGAFVKGPFSADGVSW